MLRLKLAIAMFAAGLPLSPLAAAGYEAAAAEFSKYDDAQLDAVQQQFPEPLSAACQMQVPASRELARRYPDDSGMQNNVLYSELLCAVGEQRFADGRRLLDKFEASSGKSDFTSYFGFLISAALEDGPATLGRLRELTRDSMKDFPSAAFSVAVQLIKRAGLGKQFGDLALEYSGTSYFAELGPELQQSFAVDAFDTAVRRGDTQQASRLLTFIGSPLPYLGMLADRKYETMWPAIENRVGDQFVTISSTYLASSKVRYSENMDDRDRLSTLARALYYDDRFAEAIEFVRREGRDHDALEQMQEGDAWALEAEALSLDKLGKVEEASAIYDKLASVSPERHDWVINFVVNRALRLIDKGRWQDGLAAIDQAAGIAATHGSTYAKMNLAYGRVCALYNLGRPEEAKADLDYLGKNSRENTGLVVMGLLCAKREQEAADLLAAELADDNARSSAILMLQPREFLGSNSSLPRAHDLLERNPELKKQFERYGREVPQRFAPRT